MFRITVYIFLYTVFFLLFHFETIQIGPISLSQLWKMLFFGVMVTTVFAIRNRFSPNFLKIAYLRGYKNLLNGGFLGNYFLEVISFSRYMMFPLMVNFIKVSTRSSKSVDTIIVNIARFFILSGLPYIFGFLEPLGRELSFGTELVGYIGIFQSPHAASVTTAISLLVLLNNIKVRKHSLYKRILDLCLISLGLFLLFQTFVRTGYLMFAIGIGILFLPKKNSLGQNTKWILITSSLVLTFFYLLEIDQAFYNRIFDIRSGQDQINIGSGRLLIWEASYNIWLESNIIEKFFGVGQGQLIKGVESRIGVGVISHSEFFNQLVQNGVLGVAILLAYLISLFRFIKFKFKVHSYRLAMAMFFAYASYMAVQGGMNFFIELFMALIVVKITLESEE